MYKSENPKSAVWKHVDNVHGVFDFADTVPDSWYSINGLSGSGQGVFASIGHTTKIYADGPDWDDGDLSAARSLELYKFHDLEYAKEHIDAADHYLVRHPTNDGGAVLQYAPLSSQYPSVDTEVSLSVDQNSIDYGNLSGDPYLQLYKFPDGEELDVQSALSDTTHVVLRHRYMKNGAVPTVEVDYLCAEAAINPIPDS